MRHSNLIAFIEKYGLRMETAPLLARPDWDGHPESYHFQVVITGPISGPDIKFATVYSVGPGIVDAWLRSSRPSNRAADYRPQKEDVLGCIHSDVSDLGAYCTFEEWAGGRGYDTDSRKAEKIYLACRKLALDLGRLLGPDAFREFLELDGSEW